MRSFMDKDRADPVGAWIERNSLRSTGWVGRPTWKLVPVP